ncbi:transcriptional regulator [Trichocoleus sp. FACHB-90]|uniref:helix-turn-helix domain-containing transcriptional regulator n=1 Tax=Cyanophyceae TaxID=3028117 RepID=UPI001688B2E4|nr:transcriptional regulator [Trichocoleus sp. FACHB-90]MBD1924858.1 transcriptional regulator [Trichocoleus sp. FACHB-90]
MIKSVSYHEDLISRLKDPKYAALYIEAILEEKDPEPELLKKALNNVAEALDELNMSPQAKLHQEKLEELLTKPGIYAIYSLGDWLQALGLKLSVTVKAD